jgi:hypothetical protein
MTLRIEGWPIGESEINAYEQRGFDKYGDQLVGMDIQILDEANARLVYHVAGEPSETIGRLRKHESKVQ